MSKRLEQFTRLIRTIYDNSPVFFQNFMTSVYGAHLHRIRYGSIYQSYRQELETSQWWSPDELRILQLEKLRALLTLAYEHTMFYRARFDQVGFTPSDLKSTADLLRIPLLKRQDIINHADEMVVDTYSSSNLREQFTSGTTGTPLKIYEDIDTLRRNYAFWSRFRKWFGFEGWPPRATFGGRVVVPRAQKRPPYWRYNFIERQWIFSSFHLSDDTAPIYLQQLERIKPFLLDGYVSSIYVLARYINRHGINSIRPNAIQTTSETLLDAQRAEIEKAFQCKVYNQYGQGEKAAFICECPEGNLHINDEYGIVEIIKDDRLAQPGEVGEMIVTSFCNWVMPLIRYQTNDLARQSNAESCQCGRGLALVDSVEGRVIDILRMPDGKVVPPTALTLLFDKAHAIGIAEAQIRQEATDLVIVKLVPLETITEIDLVTLEHDLRSMMGQEVMIRFDVVNSIPRTSAGKFKFVVSDLRDERQ